MKLPKIYPIFWHDVKLSLCWLVFFALIVSAYALRTELEEKKELLKRLDNCQTNIEKIVEQAKSGHIILDLEGGVFDAPIEK